MRNPDILIISHFAEERDSANCRFHELAGILARRGADVELVTSSFLHTHKRDRDAQDSQVADYRITRVTEPAYSSNVSFARLRSHRILGRNLMDYLDSRAVPDVIFCAMPSTDVAEAAARYAGDKGVRLILDVQDLWPEAFELVLKPRWLSHQLLTPLRRRAERIYRAADECVTVSETYSRRVREARGSTGGVSTTYLGTNLGEFDQFGAEPFDDTGDALALAYIGTLGHSYDLPLVFEALRELKGRDRDVILHIIGSGPLESRWRDDARDLGDSVRFHGRLGYPEMVARLRSCDIAVNPIVPGAAQSIINKVCDYAAAGLAVVSTQECEEYRQLLDDYGAGINCRPSSSDVATAIAELASDPVLRRSMGRESRRMAEELFNRAETYECLADRILP
ncbi:glycosyltransferase family 4 protein [Corynebacterium pacaense]|uniref:glycosyltransferase family 4 protein n=1 Tax=Corynebacterium pacaense TaxID=1816684 RepID=UPI0015C4D6EC|nr:glycosyltransferase family 4 protein [Corynebacterium pacaense]